ncbi:MAG: hypothetical protein RLZZ127_2021, partial [Planctomycetota bacterium]
TKAELLRVLQPDGRLYLRQGGAWTVEVKPRPATIDDWGQYHYDASGSSVSRDQVAGPAHGLQWTAGPQFAGTEGILISGGVCVTQAGDKNHQQTLVARDAWSGLPLWRRPDLRVINRYTAILDRERYYLLPGGDRQLLAAPHMIALDARTGKEVMAYTQGLRFALPDPMPQDPKQRSAAEKALKERTQAAMACLTADGLLVQLCGPEVAVLDARTGALTWRDRGAPGTLRSYPVVQGDLLYFIDGVHAVSPSYTHWPTPEVKTIRCVGLHDGKPRWTYTWPADRPGIAAHSMVPGSGRLSLSLRRERKAGDGLAAKNEGCGLILDIATGSEVWYGTNAIFEKELGGGHTGARGLSIGGRLWNSTIISLRGSMDLAKPDDASAVLMLPRMTRPVGCTGYRATARWIFGSLTTYSLDPANVQVVHTDAARTSCDVGAFPANGLSYLTTNGCRCKTYLLNANVFHARPFAGVETFPRLERGSAAPAPVPANPGDGWPTLLKDVRRSAWSRQSLPATLVRRWSVDLAPAPAPELLQWSWDRHSTVFGPLTGPVSAEGIAVVAVSHRQQIVGLDPATGGERWRTTVDGRVDTPPTIHQGLVLAGTRNGWLYALNRDSGAVVWRFCAAPRRELLVSDGQLESPWPLSGSVTITPDGILAFAGRHTDADGGIWWWRLDPHTGAVLSSGRFGADQLKDSTSGDRGRTTFANVIPVIDGERIALAGNTILTGKGGALAPWAGAEIRDSGIISEMDIWKHKHSLGMLVPGTRGLFARSEDLTGYFLQHYSHTLARLVAFDGDQFVNVGGVNVYNPRGGPGDPGNHLARLRTLPEVKTIPNPAQRPPTLVVGAETTWTKKEPAPGMSGMVVALAVAGDAVITGGQTGPKGANDHRVLVHAYADGSVRSSLEVPGRVIDGGLAASGGRLLVSTDDGSVTCFAAP